MKIQSYPQVSPVRAPPPVREVQKVAAAPAPSISQRADVVEISAAAQAAYASSQRGGDRDHDGD
jgi:hypothetical protein